ncbi:hypothetical protein CALCODRAFT_488417 [Calocera cornea HHB12733]|uniref:Ribosomal protein S21 n=1 Tax=Calocera cornea HHB12733 TaxID=1353952 RepID=A0A165CHL5_9BASI|nr:hypothetical protein CALCODRAFT_488417 [Calocera cornea HHB12733]
MAHRLRPALALASSIPAFAHPILPLLRRAFSATRPPHAEEDALAGFAPASPAPVPPGRAAQPWDNVTPSIPHPPPAAPSTRRSSPRLLPTRLEPGIHFPPSIPAQSRDPGWAAVLPLFAYAGARTTRGAAPPPPAKRWRDRSAAFLSARLAPGTASSGRSIPCAPGDLVRAYARLQVLCAKSRVREFWRRDMRYTPPSELRSRLRSIRHRRRFAEAVKEKVQTVKRIMGTSR